MTQATQHESWHLSKSVPVTLIIALLIQAAAVVWHGSQWTAAIAQNRKDIDRLSSDYVQMQQSAVDHAVQLARIEENTRNSAMQIENLVRQVEMLNRARQ